MNIECHIYKECWNASSTLARKVRQRARDRWPGYHYQISRSPYSMTVYVTVPLGHDITSEVLAKANKVILRDLDELTEAYLSCGGRPQAWSTVYGPKQHKNTLEGLRGAINDMAIRVSLRNSQMRERA